MQTLKYIPILKYRVCLFSHGVCRVCLFSHGSMRVKCATIALTCLQSRGQRWGEYIELVIPHMGGVSSLIADFLRSPC